MVLILTSNPNEDSQGTQLRINKKLTTVCSGKRSRFSKPLPNVSISKRGESNVPAGISKTSKNSEEEVSKTILSTNTCTNITSEECDVQITSITNADKKVVIEDVIIYDKNTNDKEVKEDIKTVNHEDCKKTKKTIEDISSTNIEILNLDDVIQGFSDTSAEKFSSDVDDRIIRNTDIKKSPLNENTIITQQSTIINKTFKENNVHTPETTPEKNSSKTFKENNVHTPETTPEKNSSKTSEENDVQTTPANNSRSPLKSTEPERKSTPNITPTVIDKSKYPHLTSILSKKRTEPRKEAQQKRRKKFKKGDVPPERSKMTMADLIYWNPVKTEESPKHAVTVNETPINNVVVEDESLNNVDEGENSILDSVPKLVISEDGQINIDQSSLFVSRNITQPISTEVIKKDDTTYSSFRKRPLTKHWTAKDTANFYRALSLVGADFSLMEQIFPNRTRRELKQKFKREEKFNIDIINKVLYESQTFDEITLNDFLDQNSVIDDPLLINEKEDAQTNVKEKSRKPKTCKKAKSTDNETCDSSTKQLEEETENKKAKNNKEKRRKTRKVSDDEDVEILVTDVTGCVNADDRSKRKRNVKKLPDGFVSVDSIEDVEVSDDSEMNEDDAFENTNSLENEQNSNAVEEISSESASVILDKIINGAENTNIQKNLEEETNIQQTFKEETSNVTLPLPLIMNDNEEYISVEYIKSDNSDTDLIMVGNVMAYEVVNTQTPAPKRRRKINAISPGKTREVILATKISPINYTNYTPL